MASEQPAPAGIDTSVAHGARIYDYILGGKNNFEVDRQTAEAALAVAPILRVVARENRQFLTRVVRALAEEAGIRQFLDIGSGLPVENHVHDMAKRVAPDTRVVYVDNDPLVLVHARALLAKDDSITVVTADVRDPRAIIDHPETRNLINFDEPVGVLLFGVTHFLSDDDDPAGLIGQLRAAITPGSYLALCQITHETHPEMVKAAIHAFGEGGSHGTSRSHAEIERLLHGFELLEPGMCYVSEWRPDRPNPDNVGWMYGGVGRKA